MSEQLRAGGQDAAPLVVVGSGLAGYTFVREFRKLDASRKLIMITADDGHSYSKPLLSTGFSKGKDADQLSMADAGKMAAQLDIEIRTHTWVNRIDTDARTLALSFSVDDNEATENLVFGELVLALGADVVRPELAGMAASEVLSVNSLADYRRFRERIDQVRQARREAGAGPVRIAIMGSGLIGCEFANDLLASSEAEFTVDVVSPDERPLQRVLPEPVSRALEQSLAAAGTRFHWHRTVRSVEHGGEAGIPDYIVELGGVAEAEPQSLHADVVLGATGLRPHISLAGAAGLEVNRGIITNRQLQTSVPGIYALGDCAEVDGHLLLYVQPLMQCARLLAANLTSDKAGEVSYQAMPVIVKTPACPVVLATPPEGVTGQWTVAEADSADVKALFHDDDARLRGFALSGRFVIEKQTLLRELPPLHV